MKNKKKMTIAAIIIVALIVGVLIMNSIFSSKSISGSVDITNNDNKPIIIELNMSDYKNIANIELNGKLSEGLVDINIQDSTNTSIWNGTITNDEKLESNFKIDGFGDSIKIVLERDNAVGNFSYTIKSK